MRHVRAIPLPARLSAVALGAAVAPPAPPEPEPEPAPPPPEPVALDHERVQALLDRLSSVVADLADKQRTPLDEIQQAAVELGMAVAERLIYERIRAGEFGIEAIVQATLDRFPPQASVTVYLHPDDLALLQQRLGEAGDSFFGACRIERIADTAIPRGDCKAQAGELMVWSALRRSLAELREQLLADSPFPRESTQEHLHPRGDARASA